MVHIATDAPTGRRRRRRSGLTGPARRTGRLRHTRTGHTGRTRRLRRTGRTGRPGTAETALAPGTATTETALAAQTRTRQHRRRLVHIATGAPTGTSAGRRRRRRHGRLRHAGLTGRLLTGSLRRTRGTGRTGRSGRSGRLRALGAEVRDQLRTYVTTGRNTRRQRRSSIGPRTRGARGAGRGGVVTPLPRADRGGAVALLVAASAMSPAPGPAAGPWPGT